MPPCVASRTEQPEVAHGVSAMRLFDDVVNLGVLARDELAAELALSKIPGDDCESGSSPRRRAVASGCGIRSLRGLQWRAVRLESFRHLPSTPA